MIQFESIAALQKRSDQFYVGWLRANEGGGRSPTWAPCRLSRTNRRWADRRLSFSRPCASLGLALRTSSPHFWAPPPRQHGPTYETSWAVRFPGAESIFLARYSLYPSVYSAGGGFKSISISAQHAKAERRLVAFGSAPFYRRAYYRLDGCGIFGTFRRRQFRLILRRRRKC